MNILSVSTFLFSVIAVYVFGVLRGRREAASALDRALAQKRDALPAMGSASSKESRP